MRALLDVNVLLALFDKAHTFHPRARQWWAAEEEHGWASCALTQNGFLRISTQKSYPQPIRLPDAMMLLRAWAVPPRHEFWPDDVSILDPDIVESTRLLASKQIIDIYLLALAVRHGGRLVTLDRGISLAAVRGAGTEHLVVL